ncbi:MAG TPA: DUF1566 domain-containing protein [Steroidobacteraceae bacterium]
MIQQSKSQLEAGSAEQAVTSGRAAIKLSKERWEGYALVGGALMNLTRYEAAADTLSEAIKRAPEPKQPALRDLRRQCLLAESGSPAVANAPLPATTTSQAEIVLWKSIENSSSFSEFQAYLNTYPNGAFAPLAQLRLAEAQSRLQRKTQEENLQADQEQQKLNRIYTWTDSSTGLMWQKFDAEFAFRDKRYDTFFSDEDPYQNKSFSGGKHSAQRTCANLRVVGYSDWRVPTAEELLNVIRPNANGKLNLNESILGPYYIGQWFWTSSPGNKDQSHILMNSHGKTRNIKDDTSFGFALCVRGARVGVDPS